jgi:hypothetical protein
MVQQRHSRHFTGDADYAARIELPGASPKLRNRSARPYLPKTTSTHRAHRPEAQLIGEIANRGCAGSRRIGGFTMNVALPSIDGSQGKSDESTMAT